MPRHLMMDWRILHCLLVTLALSPGLSARAQYRTPPPAPADLSEVAIDDWLSEETSPPDAVDASPCAGKCRREFWVVNTRHAPTCQCLAQGVDKIEFSQCSGGKFRRRTRAQFVEAVEPSMPTTFYVHGNALDHDYALRNARRVMHDLGRGSFRLVLWSWPAEHELGQGIAGNVREKASRSESQGYYLAWLISQLEPQSPLTLTGHSLGARTVTASLQGLASGEVAGQSLSIYPNQRRPIQAVLVAAAMDRTLLAPEARYGLAISQVDQMLITVNPGDRSLRRLGWITHTSGRALGAKGMPPASRQSPWGDRVTQVDVSNAIGGAHRWRTFTETPQTAALLRNWFFYWPVGSDGVWPESFESDHLSARRDPE